MPLLELTDAGLCCAAGGFHIDPWRAVDRAAITHAHSDHARFGSRHYLAAAPGERALRLRLGNIDLQTLRYGEPLAINGVTLSFHPAGHVLGSAQIRVEYRGEVWVASGDYKLQRDPTCESFEPVRCNTFISESTFALPIYRWEKPETVFTAINRWWAENARNHRNCVLYAYSLGKAQRVLAGLDASIGPIVVHGAVEPMVRVYRESRVMLPATVSVSEWDKSPGTLAIAPPSADGTPWLKRFQPCSTASASGWMQTRASKRQRNVDRGFVLSDHADWPGLLEAVKLTGAETVLATHGFVEPFTKHLRLQGLDARTLSTRFGEEEDA